MDEKTFVDNMIGILDLEEAPDMGDVLADFEEWDSLAFVSFLSMANKASGTRVDPKRVRTAKTIGDLYEIVKKES